MAGWGNLIVAAGNLSAELLRDDINPVAIVAKIDQIKDQLTAKLRPNIFLPLHFYSGGSNATLQAIKCVSELW